jgi:SAM-dependent methyltransferase
VEALTRKSECRLCKGRRLHLALPLQPSPIADAYVPASGLGIAQATYPLDLYLCGDCGHVQNIDVVNPELLFRDYLFTTSSSAGLVAHFRQYAEDLCALLEPSADSLVVELGSNDGTLLKFFRERGLRVLGIDPARQIADEATRQGIRTIPEFFDVALAARLRDENGAAALVCANNVFAHADDLGSIADGIAHLLDDGGIFVFEVSYLSDIIDRFLFDTVYHEHVSYHSVAPLHSFLKRHGMQLFDVQRIGSKGGSIRALAQKLPGRRPVAPSVGVLLEDERRRGLGTLAPFLEYHSRIEKRKEAVTAFLGAEAAKGSLVAGYGASTTTTTLMWHFELTRRLSFVLDDNRRKHGLYCPGCHIPVVPSEELYVRKPDCVVILAWQYADAIMNRHDRFMREGGRFVVPLPELRVFP